MGNSQSLFESIFKKNLSADDAIAYLKTVVDEYPYFVPAQFYLLQLTPKESPAYHTQAAKTALLFNNNYWLNYQLLEANNNVKFNNNQASIKIIKEQTEETFIADAPVVSIENIAPNKPLTNTTITQEYPEAIVSGETHIEPIITTAPIEEMQQNEVVEIKSQVPQEILPAIEGQESGVIAGSKAENAIEPAIEPIVPDMEAGVKIEINSSGKLVESNITATTVQNLPTTTDLPVTENEVANVEPLQINLNISKEDTETKVDSFIFEPLHTTDYFASVGIKLSEEAKPTDKLGIQLKSFTDWLKTMKKIAATEPAIDKQQTEQTDAAIQKLAEKSNAESETLTEAMADVLVQQGRVGKAIAVLEKLSLLNPTKSVFFAAKINQLKEQ